MKPRQLKFTNCESWDFNIYSYIGFVMYNSIPDIFRKQAVETLFSTPTLQACWQTWQPEMVRLLGASYTENEIINLGDRLSYIFRTTGGGGRGQGELSGGGNAWESLVCWYINLCTVGSRVVAIKKMSLVPKPIQDAITINYGNFACNTESDITIIVFPNSHEYNDDIATLNIRKGATVIPSIKKNKFNKELSDYLIERDFVDTEIGIIQCKTNWNDNAQIPMLWDMIYSVGEFRRTNLTVGRNNFSIKDSQKFTYSFVTVPSNQNTVFKPDAVAVKRVTNLSGGNYWGDITQPNVAKSLKEIFTNNFTSGSRLSLRNDLRLAIPHLKNGGALDYFKL